MQSILTTVDQEARKAGAREIHQLTVRVGSLSGVVVEALQMAFEALRRDSLAAQARLVVEPVAATCWCSPCQREFEVAGMLCECPDCGTISLELKRGRELQLVSMEVT